MKRLLLLVLALLALAFPALAEALPPEVMSLLDSAHPGHALTQVVSAADPVIAVMSQGDNHVLCIAEMQNGAWALTVDNPTALRPGKLPTFLWEGDMSLFYRYGSVHTDDYTTIYDYHAQRTADGWSNVDLIVYDSNNFHETCVSYHKGAVLFLQQDYDAEGNPLGAAVEYPPYPQPELQSKVNLAAFDIGAFPTARQELALQAIGDALYPGCTVVDGVAGEAVSLLVDLPDGTRRFLGGVWNTADWAWCVTRSTPLPAGAACDAFHSSGTNLLIHLPQDGDGYITVSLQHDGRWQVSFIGRRDWFHLGPNWVTDEEGVYYYGDFRLSLDVEAVNWEALPYTMLEAFDLLDCTAWAMVNNPDPADRLHLRLEPSRTATSLGKYYNGTPVKILETSGDWAKVDIFGIQGWMMRKYLASGVDIANVQRAMPVMFAAEELSSIPLYKNTQQEQDGSMSGGVAIMGIVGDKYFHVMEQSNPGRTGYVRQEDLWPGNG